MSARRSLHLSAALALASLLGTGAARAESPPPQATEPFRMVWSSSAGCGDSAAFLAELKSRTSRLRPARDGERATTLSLELFSTASGARGQLTVRKPDGELSVREIPGRDCHEVESAMALIAALMMDPLAASAERELVSRKPEPPPREPPPSPPSPSRPERFNLRVEPRLTARSAVAPGLAWGQALGVMLTWQSSALRPSVELLAHRSQSTTSNSAGSAELTWTAGELLACPWGVQPGSGWDFRACASLQAGTLRGAGFATFKPAAKTIFWSAAGAELQGRVQLLGPLWLSAAGGLELPFSRQGFYLDPGQVLHRVPAWGGSFGFGLGLLFF